MRRLSLLFCALLLALVAAAPNLLHAKPAHAVGAACYFSDSEGVIYDDGYAKSGPWQVGYPTGPTFNADTDIKAWRYSDPGSHHCFRGYRTSEWEEGGAAGQADMVDSLRIWICGNYAGEAQHGIPNTWEDDEFWINWNGTGGTAIALWVADAWPNGQTVSFFDYSYAGYLCGRQVDNVKTSMWKTGWSSGFDITGPSCVITPCPGYLHEDDLR